MNPFIYFPYIEFRENQRELIEKVFRSILNSEILFIEAPSGFGKTISLLTGVIPFIELGNTFLVYAVRTYREMDRVIDELLNIKNAKKIKFSELRAKREFCINENIKESVKKSEKFNLFCNELIKNGLCPYFINSKMKAHKVYDVLKDKANLRYNDIINFSINLNVCPYELNSFYISNSNIILLTYSSLLNYRIFSQIVELGNRYNKKILIADEAHNLLEKIMNTNYTEVNLSFLAKELEGYEIGMLLKQINDIFVKDEKFFVKISSYEFYKKILSKININKNYIYDLLKNNSFSFHIVEKLLDLQDILDFSSEDIDLRTYYFMRRNKDLYVGYYSFWSLNFLSEILSFFDSIVLSSGTLQPLDLFFSYLKMNNKKLDIFEIKNINLKLKSIFIRNLTTRFIDRNSNLYSLLTELILEASYVTKGGLAIFASSYQVMKGILDSGLQNNLSRDLILEEKKLDYNDIIKLIENFNEKPNSKALFAIQGGRISEGEDFSPDSIKTVLIIGIPFEEPTPILDEKIKYWESKFPGKGREYAYIQPAIRKSIQSIGRAMRRKESELFIILADGRFCERNIFKLLPNWLKKDMIIINYFKGKLKRILRE